MAAKDYKEQVVQSIVSHRKLKNGPVTAGNVLFTVLFEGDDHLIDMYFNALKYVPQFKDYVRLQPDLKSLVKKLPPEMGEEKEGRDAATRRSSRPPVPAQEVRSVLAMRRDGLL